MSTQARRIATPPACRALGVGFRCHDREGKAPTTRRLPHWSEEQAERTLRAAGTVDEWGDHSQLHEVSSAEMMRRLAKEEQAAGPKPW